MHTNTVKVRAMPSARKAHSARRVVVTAITRAPASQALQPRITVVLPLREMTIIKGLPGRGFYTTGQLPASAVTKPGRRLAVERL
jgi:hypothetical protein